jgi:predicted restriction endonuclease
MEEIYNKNNLENIYKKIRKSKDPNHEYNMWKIYLKLKDIDIIPIEDIVKLNNDFRRKRDPIFRKELFKRGFNYCILCDDNDEDYLDACHINDHAECLIDDPNNGLIMCKNHHTLYDKKRFSIIHENNNFFILVKDIAKNNNILKYNNKEVNSLRKLPKISFYLDCKNRKK